MIELLGKNIGVFRGFSEADLEFRAEIVAPYNSEMNPIIGEFLMVDISGDSALLGRITRFHPVGVLSGPMGDEYMATLSQMHKTIPEDLKESKLRYNVSVKLLGTIVLQNSSKFQYLPGVRELPHLGAIVTKASVDVIKYICNLGCVDSLTDVNVENEQGASYPVVIGHLALGNRVFNGIEGNPNFEVKFDINHLENRRTFIFARSGYGKSNLVKLLISKLYEHDQSVGILIFDPEGEYAFGDYSGRPGFADLPHLRNRVVVFTDYQLDVAHSQFVQGPVRLNLAELPAAHVVSHCIIPQKQETIFATRLKGCTTDEWLNLIQLLDTERYRADLEQVGALTHLNVGNQSVSIGAIISNLVPIVRTLHRQDSRMINAIMHHLRQGNIVIVDVRSLSRLNSERLAGMIISRIFQTNQRNFQAGSGNSPIRAILILEEAQTVLSSKASEDSPFVSWAKEGRKYGLGTIMITQQPGALAKELLSQGDNFFAFHLISASDLNELRYANAHFSKDILTQIINEPIPGNAYYWSAPHQPFVLSARILKFEDYAESIGFTRRRTTIESSSISPRDSDSALESEVEVLPTGEVTTAAELYRREIPSIESKLDDIVKNAILRQPKVRLCNNVNLNGLDREDLIAVKMWNLSFSIVESIDDDEVYDHYCESLRDGRRFISETILEESLLRLKILHDERTASTENNEKYFLLTRNAVKPHTSKRINNEPVILSN